MADQYDRDLERDSERRGGAGAPERDETDAMERKLKRRGDGGDGDDRAGDVEENRNLSGAATWRTLPSQADAHPQHARKGQAESPNDLTHEEQPKQQKRGGRG